MLISPPFLPDRGANQTEDQWLDAAMAEAEDGVFPVSSRLAWHGGRHLVAPTSSNGGQLPVRAIADGRVLFTRERTATEDRNHPLWYDQGYTSDAVVVIEHNTEIGADANDRPVPLQYYSVYQHLLTIETSVRAGQPIRRKDTIGTAGHIAGAPGRIHFEICLDTENLTRLVGRTSGTLSLVRDGRTDVLYGEVYFRLPAGTPVYSAQPPLGSVEVPPSLAVLTRSEEDWFVGLLYQGGEARLTTRLLDGRQVGTTYTEPNQGEYRLFDRAQALSQAVRQTNEAAKRPNDPVPCPAACQELLRWGRVTGPDALTPPTTPHWRQINTPAGLGWVNLNATGVTKYSDADFPQWRGWQLIDDSADRDSRCDSAALRALLDTNSDGRVTVNELQAQLASATVRERLSRTICRFPSEWESSSLDHRWGWLRTSSPEFPEPLSDKDWTAFRAYAQSLCFACPALFTAQWRIEPKAFIRHLRQCGWRSGKEIRQMVPSNAIRTAQGRMFWERVAEPSLAADSLLGRHQVPLNKALRTYGVNTPFRQAAFFGNAIQETQWLGGLAEFLGHTLWYAPWQGRGFLQLTGPGNYVDYWRWRGRAVPEVLRQSMVDAYDRMYKNSSLRASRLLADTNFAGLSEQMKNWRADVSGGDPRSAPGAEELWSPSDSAGYYWLKNNMARYADEPHVIERVAVATSQGQKVYYRSPAFWRASAAVNLPASVNNLYSRALNGFDSRCSAYGVILAVLTELLLPAASGQAGVWYPEGYSRRAVE